MSDLMTSLPGRRAILKGMVWVTGVYFYFLIFAQFAFLELLTAQGLDADAVKKVMGPMALGGILGSFSVIWLHRRYAWHALMRVAACACAVLALVAAAGGAIGLEGYAGVAFGIGGALGWLTVLLASHLLDIFGGRWQAVMATAVSTGTAYMNCNLPEVFQASPAYQAVAGALVMGVLVFVPLRGGMVSNDAKNDNPPEGSLRFFVAGVVVFTMLVWLDSAAFYIIQHNREMKMATWGESMLWRNAAVHLVVAVLAGWLILRGWLLGALVAALVLLGCAGLMATHDGLRILAGQLYPAGVSLYSVALVLYPAVWLGKKGAVRRAAVLFAVAGWVGSALGIGMAQDLNGVPLAFVGVAVVVIGLAMSFSVWKNRAREIVICSFVLVLTAGVYGVFSPQKEKELVRVSLIDQGRQVYINEGCIHCHSKYVRPGSRDELFWGPVRELKKVRKEQPVLIGNRRQGPDLMQVGLRRSKGWLKQHFIDPQSLEPKSSMPKYAYLFEDDRGDALVAYLSVYDSEDMGKRVMANQKWKVPDGEASSGRGAGLFAGHCAACHGSEGKGDGKLASLWPRRPANLVKGPFPFTPAGEVNNGLSRVIKFGILGMDMPGHETLSDSDLKALTDYVLELRAP